MSKLLMAFPSRQYSDKEFAELASIWVDVLADVPDDALALAAKEYFQSDAKFAPAPGQLRTRAVEIMGLDGDAVAETAWQKILDLVRSHDPCDDPLALIAMQRAGGLEAFRNSPTEDEHWYKERFIRAYADSFGRQTAGMALPAGNDKAGQLIAGLAARMTSATKQLERVTQ